MKGKITGAKSKMTLDITKEYIKYPQSIGANETKGTDSTAPAAKENGEKLETAFDVETGGAKGTESGENSGANVDAFVSTAGTKSAANTDAAAQENSTKTSVDSGVTAAAEIGDSTDVQALVEQKTQVDAGVETNKAAQEAAEQTSSEAQAESDEYSETVSTLTQENEGIRANVSTLKSDISQLEDTNSELQSEQAALEGEKSGLMGALSEVVDAITDVASNAFDFITGIFTGGEQQAALEAQKANIESQIQQTENEIESKKAEEEANEEKIGEYEEEQADLEAKEAENNDNIAEAEEGKSEADAAKEEADAAAEEAGEQAAAGEEQSEVLAEKIEEAGGEEAAKKEQETALEQEEAAKEQEAATEQEEAPKAETPAEENPVPPVQQPATEPVQPPVAEQEQVPPVTQTTQETVPPLTEVKGETQETPAPVYHEEFKSPEYFEYSEAIMTYQDLGIDIDYHTIANASVIELDSIVETARTQEIMKSTGAGKVVGNLASFTTKKDMDDYSEATNDFIGNFNALSSYYSANEVDDFEVKSFLTLSGDMVNNINQGYVYDTSALQQMSSDAMSLLSSLRTRVTSTEDADSNADTQFTQARVKTEDELNNTQTKLGEQAEENSHLADCKVEFLNLTTSFNNADSDSEQMSYIKLMQELGQKAERIQDNPDSQNPYLDGSLWIAA